MRAATLSLIAGTFFALTGVAHSAPPIFENDPDYLTGGVATAETVVQNIRPQAVQRGARLNGSARARNSLGLVSVANSSGGESWERNAWFSGINLFTGTYELSDVDISMPAPGHRWVIGRTYNAQQSHFNTQTSQEEHLDSDGYQGMNWSQTSQPELAFYDDADDSEDRLVLTFGAAVFAEFQRVMDTQDPPQATNVFGAVNGTAGAFEYDDTGAIDLWIYTDQRGTTLVFFGDNTSGNKADWQLWTWSDADGNTSYVGHETTAATAVTNGYFTGGMLKLAYGTAGRKYEYAETGSTYNLKKRLASVTVSEYIDSSWVEVNKVEYTYHSGGDGFGSDADLKMVTITTPLTDSGVDLVRKKYYRYWVDADTDGDDHQIQYILDFEGTRSFDYAGDSTFDDDFLTDTDGNIKPNASAYFEYDSSQRIVKAWFNGECGCSGANNGVYEFTYGDNADYTDTTNAYDEEWKSRTVIKRPDTTYVTQYFDEVGQALSRVVTDGDPAVSYSDYWATYVDRDPDGRITEIHSPAAHDKYYHEDQTTPTVEDAGAFYSLTGSGLVTVYTRVSTGVLDGFIDNVKFKEGTSGTAYLTSDPGYDSTLAITIDTETDQITRPIVNSSWSFTQEISSGTTGAYETTTAFTEYTGTDLLIPEKITVTKPEVDEVNNNGSGTLDIVTDRHYRKDGRVDFAKSAHDDSVNTGYTIGYTEYTDGRVTKRIRDANTSHADFSGITIPDDFDSDGTENHLVTTYTYDNQGRLDEVTAPDGTVSKRYYTKLADGRSVSISIPRVSGSTYYGPVSYTVSNHSGKAEATGAISLTGTGGSTTQALSGWIDENDDNILDAVFGTDTTLSRVSTSVYNESGGTLEESRAYFDIPTTWPGTEGTHYDATTFAYDTMGRRIRSKAPTGTISRSVFDDLGRRTESWVGTNDNGETGGETSGTNDMVKTSVVEYDGGASGGNSLVTKTETDPDGDWGTSTDRRTTTYDYDVRGRRIVTINPEAPHSLVKLDNLGRTIAAGRYSSSSGLDDTDDPTSLATNRIALSETSYDERGQVHESKVHKVDVSDGSLDDDITTDNWYDESGRLIKTVGGSYAKTVYDRLGRATHRFVLAEDDDTTYAHADDVSGDKVLEESQTVYESDSGDVLMRVSIQRDYDDVGGGETTGALDTNTDGGASDDLKVTAADVSGRVSITAMWYNDNGRLTDTVAYGDYNGADFDRDGLSTPTRSDTALVTTNAFNDDGSLLSTTDPKDLETRFEYDDAGRRTAVIANYVNGVPSSSTGADDNFTRYEYTDGLQVKMWVDVDGDNVEDSVDQVTEYTFGTTKGTSAGDSSIGTGHLLQKVTYPHTGAPTSADTVEYAYDATSALNWVEDQEGNIVETDYDDAGRSIHRRITTLNGGFNGDVRRITTAYTTSGRVDTITQYDNATVGSGTITDEVQYGFDDWGNLTDFDQDRNSAVGGDAYTVDHAYTKSTSGRRTVRRTLTTLPGGEQYDYQYLDTDSYDDEVSRVSRVRSKVGEVYTTLAEYDYNGLETVVGVDLAEPDLFSRAYTSSGWGNLDRFGRITTSSWYKDRATDVALYDADITYDRNSNITTVDDQIFTGFDMDYTVDDLNRLTDATRNDGTNNYLDENWTLDQLGNWDVWQADLNGDGDFTDASDFNDDRTHNVINELTGRDTDDNGTDNYTLVYDDNGNMTDDGQNYDYVYDAFGRLIEVQNRSTSALVVEYRYNGIGHRIGEHFDVDADGTVEDTSDDPWHYLAYDERWRLVARFVDTDTDPTEQWVHHQAGLNGAGGGSYIDGVIMRERDTDANGSLDERVYVLQNWRADVIALTDTYGIPLEHIRYDAYGECFNIDPADWTTQGASSGNKGYGVPDGIITSADINYYVALWNASDAKSDLTTTGASQGTANYGWPDGSVTGADLSYYSNQYTNSENTGRGVLSRTDINNRLGYAGYVRDVAVNLYHVRNRVYSTELGRWTRRDPLGYVDGANLFVYARNMVLVAVDPTGLNSVCSATRLTVQMNGPLAMTFTGSCWGWGISKHQAWNDALTRLSRAITAMEAVATTGCSLLTPGCEWCRITTWTAGTPYFGVITVTGSNSPSPTIPPKRGDCNLTLTLSLIITPWTGKGRCDPLFGLDLN